MSQIREWGFFPLLVHEADTKPLVLAGRDSNKQGKVTNLIFFSGWCEAKLLSSVFRQHLKFMQFGDCIKRKKEEIANIK